jgi:ATP-binding cassette subfamily B protein
MPTEKPKDFGLTTRRLFKRLQRERWAVFVAIIMTVVSVALSVMLPKVLGSATDVVVRSVFTNTALDFDHLGRIVALACALIVGAWVLQYGMSYILAGVVQRTMYRLRADVEDKLNRLPLSYVDKAPRGDLLSRVTNDIDNIAQSLQQTLSQMLTQVLMLIGTVALMIWISWLLSLVALVTIPVSMIMMSAIASRSRTRFIAQWRHTGNLYGQVEEAFTGHGSV